MSIFDPWSRFLGRLERRKAPKISAVPGELVWVRGAPYVVRSVSHNMQGEVELKLLLAVKCKPMETISLDDWKDMNEDPSRGSTPSDPEQPA